MCNRMSGAPRAFVGAIINRQKKIKVVRYKFMKKSTRRIKRAIATFLVVLMSIESFGAVVSDNDGSAFITKAEFDALENDFQAQINIFNTNIDDKIDTAISAYLAGMTIAREKESDGYLGQIKIKNENDIVFSIGGTLGVTTQDQFLDSVKVVNPFIEVNGIYGWAGGDPEGVADTPSSGYKTGYYQFDYYSHVPGNWNGQWEGAGNGVNVVSLDLSKIKEATYLSLNKVYKVRKWQFQAIFAGQQEYSAWWLEKSKPDPALVIDLRGDSAFGIVDNINPGSNNNRTITIAKCFSNRFLSETTLTRSASGNFYTVSDSTTDLYGWEEKNNYKYDTSLSKTETNSINCFIRRQQYYQNTKSGKENWSTKSDTVKFTYVIHMPKQYKFKFKELINKSSTEVIGTPVYCYNGLPLITTDEDANKIKLPLKITNCGTTNGKYKIYISDKPFDNQLARNSTNEILYKDDNFVNTENRDIEINFNNHTERILWLKLDAEVTDNENIKFKVDLQSNQHIVETLGE